VFSAALVAALAPGDEIEALMTVAELIAHLQTLPPTVRVMVRGYEGGYVDANPGDVCKVDLNVIDSRVFGPHALQGEGWNDATETVDAVIL
jgi:hypothetical protein